MKAVIQRVTKASVISDGVLTGQINKGMMILAGFVATDTEEDLKWTAGKISDMRIFDDKDSVMNLSIKGDLILNSAKNLDIKGGTSLVSKNGEILLVSQFTLFASTKKGNRPSYSMAAPREISKPLYDEFTKILEEKAGLKIQTGIFGSDMQVSLVNSGPVTIIIDSKNKV